MFCPKCGSPAIRSLDGDVYECTNQVVVELVPPQPHAPAGIPIYGPCRCRFSAADGRRAHEERIEWANRQAAAELEQAAQRERETARKEAAAKKQATVDSHLPALPQPREPADVEGKGVLPIFLSPLLFAVFGSLASAFGSSDGGAWGYAIAGTILVIVLAELRPIARSRRATAMVRYREEIQAANTRDRERTAMRRTL